MSLTKNDLNELLSIAKKAATQAGEIISRYQGKSLSIDLKEGGDSLASQIVTEVDGKAERAILKVLEPTIKQYDLGLLAEETSDDQSRFVKDYFWCIDPLDGTLAFSQNQDGYSTSIALVTKEGEALIGVVNDPRNNNLYSAIKGAGAWKNEQSFKITPQGNDTTVINHTGGAVMQAISTIELAPCIFYKKPKETLGGGCLWDYAATSVIQSEAGGVNSDFSFRPLELNATHSVFMNHVGVCYSAGLSPDTLKQIIARAHTI